MCYKCNLQLVQKEPFFWGRDSKAFACLPAPIVSPSGMPQIIFQTRGRVEDPSPQFCAEKRDRTDRTAPARRDKGSSCLLLSATAHPGAFSPSSPALLPGGYRKPDGTFSTLLLAVIRPLTAGVIPSRVRSSRRWGSIGARTMHLPFTKSRKDHSVIWHPSN